MNVLMTVSLYIGWNPSGKRVAARSLRGPLTVPRSLEYNMTSADVIFLRIFSCVFSYVSFRFPSFPFIFFCLSFFSSLFCLFFCLHLLLSFLQRAFLFGVPEYASLVPTAGYLGDQPMCDNQSCQSANSSVSQACSSRQVAGCALAQTSREP